MKKKYNNDTTQFQCTRCKNIKKKDDFYEIFLNQSRYTCKECHRKLCKKNAIKRKQKRGERTKELINYYKLDIPSDEVIKKQKINYIKNIQERALITTGRNNRQSIAFTTMFIQEMKKHIEKYPMYTTVSDFVRHSIRMQMEKDKKC